MAFFLKGNILLSLISVILGTLVLISNQEIFFVPETQASQNLPTCLGLSGYPTRGGAVLTSTFTGAGFSQGGNITAFEFDFGDGQKEVVAKEVGETGSQSLSHSYRLPGVYWASLRVKDSNGEWSQPQDLCKVKVEVEGEILDGLSVQPKTGMP